MHVSYDFQFQWENQATQAQYETSTIKQAVISQTILG